MKPSLRTYMPLPRLTGRGNTPTHPYSISRPRLTLPCPTSREDGGHTCTLTHFTQFRNFADVVPSSRSINVILQLSTEPTAGA